jgi:predicted CXXCH cytochrome family protein
MGRRRPDERAVNGPGSGNRPLILVWLLTLAIAAAVVLIAGTAGPAGAQDEEEEEENDRRWNSELCLGCHDGSDDTLTFPSGEEIGLAVDGAVYMDTQHAANGVQCVHCHTTIARFPHPEVTFADARTFEVELSKACGLCHWREFTIRLDRDHAPLGVAGTDDLPVCTDCHDPHAARSLAADHPDMQARCAECHTDAVGGSEAIHVLNPTAVEEADAPPLILFYGLIVLIVIGLVVLGWGGVALTQWMRRRTRTPAGSPSGG